MAGIRDKVREFALSLPETSEEHPWGEDVAKVSGKIFVFLGDELGPHHGQARGVALARTVHRRCGADRLRPGQVGLGDGSPPSGGREPQLLRDWTEESYRIVAPKRLVSELDTRVPRAG